MSARLVAMSGAGEHDDASRRSARTSPRVQTSSIAIGATVVALVVALGAAGLATRQRPSEVPSGLALRAADTADDAAPATPNAPAGGGTRERPGRPAAIASPRTPSGSTPTSGAAGGNAAEGSPATATGPGVSASGDDPRTAAADEDVFDLRPPAAGEWSGVAHVKDGVGLLPAEQDVATTLVVSPQEAGAQRIDVRGQALAVAGETVRYDRPGRRAYVLDLWTGDAEPVRFSSSEGFLDLPSTARPGATWAWTGSSDDGRTSIDASLRYVGRSRTAMASGREVEVVEYEEALRLGGAHNLTITRKVRFALELGLPVRVEETASGTNASGSSVDRQVTFELTDTDPAAEPVVDRP